MTNVYGLKCELTWSEDRSSKFAMKNNFYLALTVLTPISLGFYHASSDGVTISYKMTGQNICHTGSRRLAEIQGLSLPDCVKECALRKSCRALHYRRRFFVCDIFQSIENEDIGHGDCTFINASDISVHTVSVHWFYYPK